MQPIWRQIVSAWESTAVTEAAVAECRSEDSSLLTVPVRCRRVLVSTLFLVLATTTTGVSAREFSSYAQVAEDGTLRVGNRKVHLYGIYLPPTGQHCSTLFSPRVCGSRAAVALDFKIQGFVHCKQKSINRDRSVTAVCYVNHGHNNEGEDLSAYLIEQGWAMALPNAPFEYQALEEIARSRSAGIWGFTIDGIQRRSPRR